MAEKRKDSRDLQQIQKIFETREKSGNRFHPVQDWYDFKYKQMVAEGVGQPAGIDRATGQDLSTEDPAHVSFGQIFISGIADNRAFSRRFPPRSQAPALALAWLMLEDIYIRGKKLEQAIVAASDSQNRQIASRVLLIALQTLESANAQFKELQADRAIDKVVVRDSLSGRANKWPLN